MRSSFTWRPPAKLKIEMDSDEEETFIGLGHPVEQLDDDAPLKKPIQVQDLAVRDKKGRQRFHGAFTGGFSAGYFNSVGSKEGFAPAEFVSSRDKKSDGYQQKPEDFMDEEDFSEHGIAPRKLVTSEKFSTEERRKRRHDEGQALMTGTVFEGTTALTDFILPEKLTMGIRLLKKLGWRQGHGIGSKNIVAQVSKEKTYGCSLPPKQEEDSDEDLQFASKDKNPISFDAKDNVHGLGYSGLNPASALPGGHVNLFEPPKVTKSGRKGIRGQAFGVGALEDDDDDVYSTDHMSNYDMTMEIEDSSNLHGWTAPKHKHQSRHLPIGYVGKVLEGFKLSDQQLHQKKVFPAPELPRHFRPVHAFQKPKDDDTNCDLKQSQQTAITRSIALGEVGSVFDLVSSKDKQNMELARKGTDKSVVQVSDKTTMGNQSDRDSGLQLVPVLPGDRKDPDPHTETEKVESTNPLFQGGSLTFKPFIKDERKQARYEKYLSLVKLGKKDAYEEVTEGHMTEWEREREKEEFIKAAKMYKPLPGMIASRFTRAKYDDTDDKVDVPTEQGGDKDDRMKAAEMKMYGQLTRDVFEWHPDRLLCRRFNVPDPYPGSGIVGLPTVKKDKFSVFNFLTFPSTETTSEQQDDTQEQEIPPQPTSSTNERDRTVSDSPKPVSIFSHLVQTTSEKHKPETVTKATESTRPKSIFSHLMVEKEARQPDKQLDREISKVPDNKQSGDQDTAQRSEDVKPSVDLFSAIFGNTDSEEDEDEEDDESSTVTEGPGKKEDTTVTGKSEDTDIVHTRSTNLPGAPVPIETIEERLAPVVSEDRQSYGPLPPSASAHSSTHAKSTLISTAEYLARRESSRDYVDPDSHKYRDDHRKHKHSKHKHKKDKKSKHKKSKHKKKEKKKRRYSDSDESDGSSSDEDNVPTNRELLQKLKSLPKGKYLL